jgi:hypothetical protein
MAIIRDFIPDRYVAPRPLRFTQVDFINFDKLKKKSHFNLWFSGVNPETGNKIKINGDLHYRLGRNSGYKYYEYYQQLQTIDRKAYYDETLKIMDEYALTIVETAKLNDKIRELNKQIAALKWNEFIVFENKKYGIPKVTDNVHNENDCKGKFKLLYTKGCECHLCEDWNGCNNPKQTNIYSCEKCGFEYTETQYLGNH